MKGQKMQNFLSKKLLVAILGIVATAGNNILGLNLDNTEIMSIAGLAASYIGGQSIIDTKNK